MKYWGYEAHTHPKHEESKKRGGEPRDAEQSAHMQGIELI